MKPNYLLSMEKSSKYYLQQQLNVFKSELFNSCNNRRGVRKKSGDLLEHYYCKLVSALSIPITIEIGAHEATFSKNIKCTRPSTECYAYEANPFVYEKFEKSLKEAGIDYRNLAISNTDGFVNLEIPISRRSKAINKDNPIASILKRDQPGFKYDTVSVTSAKINSLFKNKSKNKAIWVDVEGAQYEVLQSMSEQWPTIQLIYIEVETNNVWFSSFNKQDIYQTLKSKGYLEIMLDNLAGGQYNTVFAHSSVIKDKKLLNIVGDYLNALEALV